MYKFSYLKKRISSSLKNSPKSFNLFTHCMSNNSRNCFHPSHGMLPFPKAKFGFLPLALVNVRTTFVHIRKGL